LPVFYFLYGGFRCLHCNLVTGNTMDTTPGKGEEGNVVVFVVLSCGLPLPDILALGAQHGKLDAGLCLFALLGTPSILPVHDYYPFALEDGGRLAPMAAGLVDRLTILVAVSRFPGMGVAGPRSLRSDSYFRIQHFVCRTTYVPFRRFLEDVHREFSQSVSAALHGTLGSYLRDALQESSADDVACLSVPRA
jgi:hypothetical protein